MAKRRLKKSVKKAIAVVTTVFAGLSVFQIVPIEAEESKYTASVEDDTQKLTVDASAPSGVLPEDAKLVVTPIKNDGNDSLYEDTLNKLNEEAGKENQTVDAFIAYDIQFEKDDKEVEPENGKVNVDLKWETAVKPEGVQAGDKISVVHLKDDSTVEDLSKNEEEVEKDSSKDLNKATVETDENDTEAVQSASVTSDSFSVYTVVWTRENTPTINIHYVDENGNEISPVDTVNAPTDAGVDTLAKAIDGYTYASATIDNGNATELKSENGVLYFNDGTNWNQASSTDVYLTYTEDAPVPAVDSSSAKTLNADTKDGKYSVTVSYNDDAQIPDGSSLSVKELSKKDKKYTEAKKLVDSEEKKEEKKAENADNASSLSSGTITDGSGTTLNVKKFAIKTTEGKSYFNALDIKILDSEGNEVEPSSEVSVSIVLNKPETDVSDVKDSLTVHHIVENPSSETKKESKDTKAVNVKPETNVTDNGGVTAEFNTESFSTYALTYTAFTDVNNLADKTFLIAHGTERSQSNTANPRVLLSSAGWQDPDENNAWRLNGVEFTYRDAQYKETNATTYTTGKVLITDGDNDIDNILWQFERADGANNNQYYVKAVSKNGQTKGYLHTDGNNKQGSLTVQSNDKQLFTVESNNGQIKIVRSDGSQAVNKYENENHFGTWGSDDGSNEKQYLYEVNINNNQNNLEFPPLETVETLDTSKDFTIRMIDYNNDGTGDVSQRNIGGAYHNTGEATQGLLENTLQNGYPVAKGLYTIINDVETPTGQKDVSLKDQFSENKAVSANHLFLKKNYEDTGYYEFSSFQNYAQLNKESGNFTVYKQLGTPQNSNNFFMKRGNFMPYNSIESGKYSVNSNDYDEDGHKLSDLPNDSEAKKRDGELLYKTNGTDYNFGMYVNADFLQLKNGYIKHTNPNTLETTNNPVIYEFNGDDDLWVFVDNVLLLDIGGIHDAHSGTINFATGQITAKIGKGQTGEPGQVGYQAADPDYEVTTSIKNQYKNAGVFPDGSKWDDNKVNDYFIGDTFKDYSSHNFKMFYMERGGGASNLHMKFNLPIEKNVKFIKTDENNKPLAGAKFELKDSNGTAINNLNVEGSQTDGVFSNNGAVLINGEYTLTETDAPNGYNKLNHSINLEVNDSNITASSQDDTGTYKVAEVTSETSTADDGTKTVTYKITVKNKTGIKLPNTGGIGKWPYILGGSALIIFAAYMMQRRRKTVDSYDRLE